MQISRRKRQAKALPSCPDRTDEFFYLGAEKGRHAICGAGVGAAAGGYVYNYSPIETMRMASDRWLGADELVQLLDRFRPLARSGDVYARLAQLDRR